MLYMVQSIYINRAKYILLYVLLFYIKGEADINEIIIQLRVNCNCDKCQEQAHGAINDYLVFVLFRLLGL